MKMQQKKLKITKKEKPSGPKKAYKVNRKKRQVKEIEKNGNEKTDFKSMSITILIVYYRATWTTF